MRWIVLAGMVVVLLPGAGIGQKDVKTIDQINLEQMAVESGFKRTLWDTVNFLTARKKFQCLKAFGNQDFCQCLAEVSGVDLSFRDYIASTTKNRTEIGYDKLSDDNKAFYENAHKTREICVSRLSGPRFGDNPFADLIPAGKR